MAGHFFYGWTWSWIEKWLRQVHRFCKKNQKEKNTNNTKDEIRTKFSPLTYHNPCIGCMDAILNQIIDKKQIPYQNLELIIIDSESENDDDDIWEVLWQLSERLNYLLLVTDRPCHFEKYSNTMYEDNGLIVQKISKSGRKRVRGNVVMDFERTSNTDIGNRVQPAAIYLPIYKKPWEIAENLDITVPVGYNTLIVEGIYLPQPGERFLNEKIDRLDREFRKG